MWSFLYHWLYVDIWQPVWPNWFAAVPISLYGIVKVKAWDKRRKRREEERHEDLKAHITAEHKQSRVHLENVLAKRKR